MNSFEVPKTSHRILPAPELETNKMSQNERLQQSKTKNGSNALLPTLKSYLDDDENISQNRNSSLPYVAHHQRIESQ